MKASIIMGVFISLLGAAPAAAAPPSRIWILHDASGFAEPRCDACRRADVHEVPESGGAGAIIVTGHSTFGSYLGLSPRFFARTLAKLAREPEFLVLDTCYGAQAELLLELDRAGVHPAVIIASAAPVPPDGFDYGDVLDREDVTAATLVDRWRGGKQTVTVIPSGVTASLDAAIVEAHAEARACVWTSGLASVLPNLAPKQVPRVDGPVLVHLPPSDFPSRCFPDTSAPRGRSLRRPAAAVLMVGAPMLAIVAASAALRWRRR